MQRIERAGVIFLVLLLVTITAVSFWDDGEQVLDEGPTAEHKVLAQEDHASQTGGRRPLLGSNRRLPDSAAPRSKPRRSNIVPARGKTAPGGPKGTLTAASAGRSTLSSPFQSLPATVAPKPQARELGFPKTIERDTPAQHKGPSRSLFAARAEPSTKNLATTNYDTIDNRLRQLDASVKPRSSVAASAARQRSASALSGTPGLTYTVVAGDTLSGIAYKTLGSSKRWREIQAANGNLDPAMLSVGSELRLPSGAAPSSARALPALGAAERTPQDVDGFYIVRKGDMLSAIALERLGGASRWREILALNPAIDPNRLQEGARLRLPDSNVPATRYASKRPSTVTTGKSRGKNRVR